MALIRFINKGTGKPANNAVYHIGRSNYHIMQELQQKYLLKHGFAVKWIGDKESRWIQNGKVKEAHLKPERVSAYFLPKMYDDVLIFCGYTQEEREDLNPYSEKNNKRKLQEKVLSQVYQDKLQTELKNIEKFWGSK